MSKVFEYNKSGYFELMNSEAMQSILSSYGQRIKENAESIGNGEYELVVGEGQTRSHAYVRASDSAAVADNYKNNTLLKALGNGQ